MASKTIKIKPNYNPRFHRFTKKQSKPFQAVLQEVIEDEILLNPLVGQQKIADLADFWIYKFTHQKKEFLIAYCFPQFQGRGDELRRLLGKKTQADLEIELLMIDFVQVGTHENFYRELKTLK